MTRLEELLERAADPRPLPFDSTDISARVRRRRRTRRSVVAVAGVVLLGIAVVAVNVRGDDDQTVTYGSGAEGVPDLVARWTAVVFSDREPQPLSLRLEQLDTEIERAQDRVDRSGTAEERADAQDALGQLLTLRASVVTSDGRHPWRGVLVDFRGDGTLGGFDGCNDFGGHWALDGDRLQVTQLSGSDRPCPPSLDSGLQSILEADPMLSVPSGAPGDLELRTADGSVTFDRAEGLKGYPDTELGIDLGADFAKVTFRTPLTIDAGPQRLLASWASYSSSETPVPAWAEVAIDGAPEGCELGLRRWEDVEADIARGTSDPSARMVLDGLQDDLVRQAVADVPPECAGEFTLVVVMGAAGQTAQERVPITIR